jgi:phosphoribosyl-ATP pyrophosphohydrolase/phosphoribosyl-AMP cyclohydrolase
MLIGRAMNWLEDIRWNADGLAPAIAQEASSGKVLTLAWMNREALKLTRSSGEAHYWSRSRARIWHKGESSGHVQKVREIRLDCDRDAILLLVDQQGGLACHTGHERCFYRQLQDGAWRETEPVIRDPLDIYGGAEVRASASHAAERSDAVLARLAATIRARMTASADSSYVASLFARGEDAILKKIGEEATETVMAGKDRDPARITSEVADLWFHCCVLLAHHGLGPSDVLNELERREGTSGHAEKAARVR